jgi:glycosyltransferase involved in cell wall biosynthesis
MELSILIPTMKHREDMFKDLQWELQSQINRNLAHDKVEILWNNSQAESIGEKRNDLLNRAKGKYVAFVDDDDWVSKDYIKLLLEAISKSPDCVSLRGVITVNGENPEIFEHSIKYPAWQTIENPNDGVKYVRCPNHLNCIKSSIAKQFMFVHSNFGEDRIWSEAVFASGQLKNEIYLDEVLYHYKYISDKK